MPGMWFDIRMKRPVADPGTPGSERISFVSAKYAHVYSRDLIVESVNRMKCSFTLSF